jgi:LmbE family N-acetylglucosaminyl deacetylase
MPLLISPHLDDVCYSVAGLAARARAGAPRHRLYGLGSPRLPPSLSATRRRPPRRVRPRTSHSAAASGYRHALGLPDTSAGGTDFAQLRRPAGDEDELRRRATDELRALMLRLGTTRCWIPLGLGGRADHLVTREAAVAAAAETGTAVTYTRTCPARWG